MRFCTAVYDIMFRRDLLQRQMILHKLRQVWGLVILESVTSAARSAIVTDNLSMNLRNFLVAFRLEVVLKKFGYGSILHFLFTVVGGKLNIKAIRLVYYRVQL